MLCVDVSQFIYDRLIPWPFVRDESIIFRVISFLAYDGYNLGCHLLQQKDVIFLANLFAKNFMTTPFESIEKRVLGGQFFTS